MEFRREKRRRLFTGKIYNLLLVCLDQNIDKFDHDFSKNSLRELRETVNTVQIFTDVDECIACIKKCQDEKVIIIISEELSEKVVPIVRELDQVYDVYIALENKVQDDPWLQQYTKLKSLTVNSTSICEDLQETAMKYEQDSFSISVINPDDIKSKLSLNRLNPSFMYTQILKEILLEIEFNEEHVKEFQTSFQDYFLNDSIGIQNVNRFVNTYCGQDAIQWYSSESFLYTMLNRALRNMDVDLIITMGFFLRDLHQKIVSLHAMQYTESSDANRFTVYRGQSLSKRYFDQLQATKDGLMSFNCFLSTSLDRRVALMFAESSDLNSHSIPVIFEITVDPKSSPTSFANISSESSIETEAEILFSMNSVFRIDVIQADENVPNLSRIHLTLISDYDKEMMNLTEYMRNETTSEFNGWHRLGALLLNLEQKERAMNVYNKLLIRTGNQEEKALCYDRIGTAYSQMVKYSEALSNYEKAYEIRQKLVPSDHPYMATSYNNFGLIYSKMAKYPEALSNYKKAFEIRQMVLHPDHPDMAVSYNNIGSVYSDMAQYSEALSHYEKAHEIRQKSLPPDHPIAATSYITIGSIYSRLREYPKALSHYEKALEIRQKSLPPGHSYIALCYNNIGLIYFQMKKYFEALPNYKKALEIGQKSLSPYDPKLATGYNNIGSTYSHLRNYSEALSNCTKALEIRQKSLDSNHPSLALSYSTIGSIYADMGEHSEALSQYQKALEIRQKSLPPDHPDIAASYNSIGSIYSDTKEYPKALENFERALEVGRKLLSSNDPNIATGYYNVGSTYSHMGEYSKALSNLEKALEIRQTYLPNDDSGLISLQQQINDTKQKM